MTRPGLLAVLLASLVLPADAATDPPPRQWLEGLLQLPPFVTSGETIEVTVLDPKQTPPEGRWLFGGKEAQLGDRGSLRVEIPKEMSPLGPFEVVYTDPSRKRRVVASALEQTRILPPPADNLSPGIQRCGGRLSPGPIICVCGWFPGADSRAAVRIDGRPAGPPVAASNRALCFDAGLGLHRISAAPGLLAPPDGVEIVALEVRGELRRNSPKSRTAIWTIAGTPEPVELQIFNRTPQVIHLEGGDSQVVRTSGGERNSVELRIQDLADGEFQIDHYLAASTSAFQSPFYLGILEQIFKRNVAASAESLEQSLRRIAADATTSDGRLYVTSRVTALIESSKSEILARFDYPELAAFRESTDDLFLRLRKELEDASIARENQAETSGKPAVRRAAFEARNQSKRWIEKTTAENLIRRAIDFLRSLEKQGFTRNLYIGSRPSAGASFRIWPESFPSDERRTVTNRPVCNIPLGRYRYEATQNGKKLAGPLDLLRETQSLLSCSFENKNQAGGDVPCAPTPGKVEGCP